MSCHGLGKSPYGEGRLAHSDATGFRPTVIVWLKTSHRNSRDTLQKPACLFCLVRRPPLKTKWPFACRTACGSTPSAAPRGRRACGSSPWPSAPTSATPTTLKVGLFFFCSILRFFPPFPPVFFLCVRGGAMPLDSGPGLLRRCRAASSSPCHSFIYALSYLSLFLPYHPPSDGWLVVDLLVSDEPVIKKHSIRKRRALNSLGYETFRSRLSRVSPSLLKGLLPSAWTAECPNAEHY